jgi:hypothetical protein
MVADLVDEHVRDEVAERFLVLGPVIQERAAVEPDHVGELPGLKRGRPLRQADAAKEAEQIELALAFHLLERFVVGEILDPDHDAFAELPEFSRQALERRVRHRLELRQRGGLENRPIRHGVVTAQNRRSWWASHRLRPMNAMIERDRPMRRPQSSIGSAVPSSPTASCPPR